MVNIRWLQLDLPVSNSEGVHLTTLDDEHGREKKREKETKTAPVSREISTDGTLSSYLKNSNR